MFVCLLKLVIAIDVADDFSRSIYNSSAANSMNPDQIALLGIQMVVKNIQL